MADPRWNVELTVTDTKTGERQEVRVDSSNLAEALGRVTSAVGSIFKAELTDVARQIEQAFHMICGDPRG